MECASCSTSQHGRCAGPGKVSKPCLPGGLPDCLPAWQPCHSLQPTVFILPVLLMNGRRPYFLPMQIVKMSLTGEVLPFFIQGMYTVTGAVMGTTPGGEFLAAIEAAKSLGAQVSPYAEACDRHRNVAATAV
jgi:hypothetical protein